MARLRLSSKCTTVPLKASNTSRRRHQGRRRIGAVCRRVWLPCAVVSCVKRVASVALTAASVPRTAARVGHGICVAHTENGRNHHLGSVHWYLGNGLCLSRFAHLSLAFLVLDNFVQVLVRLQHKMRYT
jgi:hypothetical protein